MKTLNYFFHWLFVKNLEVKLDEARTTYKMVLASTSGKSSHFYNEQGEQIRGFFTAEHKHHHIHPLLEKYL